MIWQVMFRGSIPLLGTKGQLDGAGRNTEQKGSEIRFHSHLCFSACLQYASVVCYSVWAHSWIAGTRPCHDQKQADSPERRAMCWALGHDLEFGSFRCGLFIGLTALLCDKLRPVNSSSLLGQERQCNSGMAFIRGDTQAWLKRAHLKCARGCTACGGSNPPPRAE